MAHSALESAWGRSQIARDKNNFFGIAAMILAHISQPRVLIMWIKESLERPSGFVRITLTTAETTLETRQLE